MRRALDFYPTEPGITRAILDVLGLPMGSLVLDPACGDGAILDVASGLGMACVGIELDAARAAVSGQRHRVTCADSLTAPWPGVDAVIQNPPFSEALAFVERGAEYARERGVPVASLVRLSFLSSKGRAAFHSENPSDVYVLAGRPSFTGDGKTDSADYCWLVHRPGGGGRWCPLTWTRDAAMKAAS